MHYEKVSPKKQIIPSVKPASWKYCALTRHVQAQAGYDRTQLSLFLGQWPKGVSQYAVQAYHPLTSQEELNLPRLQPTRKQYPEKWLCIKLSLRDLLGNTNKGQVLNLHDTQVSTNAGQFTGIGSETAKEALFWRYHLWNLSEHEPVNSGLYNTPCR